MIKQSWGIMPKTILGKWSFGLIVAMPILVTIGTSFANSIYKSVPAGGTIINDIAARPALALTVLAGITVGVFAFITGVLASILQKERAVSVIIAVAVGAILLFFLAGEVVSPH